MWKGGRVSAKADRLVVEGATTLTIVLTAATGYRGFEQKPDTPQATVNEAAIRQLNVALKQSYSSLMQRHVADHRKLFDRVSLTLGSDAMSSQPTDERLASFATTPDPSLLALYFQYGRYLLISSSRPGTQPANLQGIWNYQVQPPWSSNWTSNINVQMNYWPAETCNLSDCSGPLFDLIEGLGQDRRARRKRDVRLGRMGDAPQYRPVACGEPGWHGRRTTHVGQLGHERAVALRSSL